MPSTLPRIVHVCHHLFLSLVHSVTFNYLGRDFFNALSEKDVEGFKLQLIKYLIGFCFGEAWSAPALCLLLPSQQSVTQLVSAPSCSLEGCTSLVCQWHD